MYNLSTKTHEGPSSQRRPTQAHEEGKRPICMFFFIMYFFKNLQLIHESLRRPTATNDGQQRPAAAHGRPTQAHEGSQHPTTIGMFFLIMYCFLNLQLIQAGPQRQKESPRGPTAANEGRRRPMKREKRPKRCQRCRLGWHSKFFLNVFFFNVQLIYESPRRPTAANEGR